MTNAKRGFPVTRKRVARRRSFSLPLWFWLLALAVLLWTAGATLAWSQSSGSSSSSSSSDLMIWDELSTKFNQGLDEQSTRLQQALSEMTTSKVSLLKLTILLEQSLRANEDLKNYNAQIGARMQERDEDLAAAYADADRLEKQNLKLVIAVIIMGVIITFLVLLIIAIIRR